MEFGILGPLRVASPVSVVDVGGTRPRRLLTALSLWVGEAVSADRLIDLVWADSAPAGAANALQAQVSKLRRALGDGLIATNGRGYLLDVNPATVDAHRFAAAFAHGSSALAAGDPSRAAVVLGEALGWWRGPALADLDHPEAAPEATRLDELRLIAIEHRFDAELQLGRHQDVVAELEGLTAAHPTRERLWALAMLALYRCGRQADALHTFGAARRILSTELGLEPGPELRRLEAAVIAQDPSLDLIAPVVVSHREDTARTPEGNLPLDRTSFVGRMQERKAVGEQLAAQRLVTLIGPGGAGKTRLALAVARDHQPAGGAWLVELAPIGADDDAVAAVAGALGATDPTLSLGLGRDPLSRVVDFIGSRELLLVLDNCEHLVGEVARLADVLLQACPSLVILATSREGLGVPGEHLVAVPPMRADDAVELFVGRAVAAGSNEADLVSQGPVLADICRRLDGLPLAIELAAARARHLSLADLADRLDDRFRLLTGGARSVLPRQQTLRAVVDWSYDLLDDGERRVLERLSVFSGGCTLAAAEAVCGGYPVDPLDVASLLGSLADKSLVVIVSSGSSMRYGLLQTLALYGRERLAARSDGDADATRDRHLRYFGAWGADAMDGLRGHDQPEWIGWTRAEQENLRTAMTWAAARGGDEASLVVGDAVAWYWFLEGGLDEAIAFLDESLAGGPPGDSSLRARVLAWRTWLAMMTHGPGHESGMVEAMEMAQRVGDPLAIGHVALLAAEADHTGGASSDNDRLIKEGQAAMEEIGYAWGRGVGMLVAGFNEHQRGDHLAASQSFAQSERAFAEAGDRWGEGIAVGELAGLAELRGDYAEATALLERSAMLIEASGAPTFRDAALARLGNLALLEGDLERADRLHGEAFERVEHRPLPFASVVVRVARSLSLRALGRYDEARGHLVDALDRLVPHMMPMGMTAVLSGLGYLAEHQGRLADAGTHHREALGYAKDWGDHRAVAQAIEGLAGVAAAEGDGPRAAELLGVAHRLRCDNGGPMPPGERTLEVDRIEAAARAGAGSGFGAAFAAGEQADPDEFVVRLLSG